MSDSARRFRLKVQRILEHAGGKHARVARLLGCEPSTVAGLLEKTDEELDRVHTRIVKAVDQVLADFGIEIGTNELAVLWDPALGYHANLGLRIPLPVDRLPPPPVELSTTVVGIPVRSPFGASASVITADSNRIRYLARTGCDVLVYKTVRDRAFQGHDAPNVLACEQATLSPTGGGSTALVQDVGPGFVPTQGMLNRFGMPSQAPVDWQRDFRQAVEYTDPGQLVILSVVGTALPGDSTQDLVESFCRVAELGAEAGARVFDFNFSCPNCDGKEGSVFSDPRLAQKILKAVSIRVRGAKLIPKVGYIEGEALHRFVGTVTEFADGISGINTFSAEAFRVRHGGKRAPAFGIPGVRAGVSGSPLREYALRFTEGTLNSLARLGASDKSVLAVGGVSTPEDAYRLYSLGASAVLATTKFFENCDFGIEVREHFVTMLADEIKYELERELQRAHLLWWKALNELGGPRDGRLLAAANSVWSTFAQGLAARHQRRNLPWRHTEKPSLQEFKRLIQERISAPGQGQLFN